MGGRMMVGLDNAHGERSERKGNFEGGTQMARDFRDFSSDVFRSGQDKWHTAVTVHQDRET